MFLTLISAGTDAMVARFLVGRRVEGIDASAQKGGITVVGSCLDNFVYVMETTGKRHGNFAQAAIW